MNNELKLTRSCLQGGISYKIQCNLLDDFLNGNPCILDNIHDTRKLKDLISGFISERASKGMYTTVDALNTASKVFARRVTQCTEDKYTSNRLYY